MRVKWIAPHDGYQEISSYLIEFQATSGDWFSSNEYCLGEDPQLLKCDIPMLKLHDAPLNLVFDVLIQVRVKVNNSYGQALAPSPVNTEGAFLR